LITTVCPNCRKAIRVPPDALGQKAQCPFCKCHFRAPVQSPEGLTEPVLIRRNPFANRVTAPAVALLFIGLIGLVSNGIQTVRTYTDPEQFERQTREVFESAAERSKTPELRDKIPATLKWWPRIRLASSLLSLVTIAGAVSMLRQRSHGLAMLGSVVTMFNVANCCCFAGIFVGGWSLFVLMDPAVRARFQSPPAA
jgi:hypothetical protein